MLWKFYMKMSDPTLFIGMTCLKGVDCQEKELPQYNKAV